MREDQTELEGDTPDPATLMAELRLREGVLRALGYAADRFLRSDDPNEHMDRVLELLGQATDVSRIYIFANHVDAAGELRTTIRYEWTAPEVEPQIDLPELQDVPFAQGFGRWERYLSGGQPIQGHVRDFPPSERELLEAQDIRTLLVIPIFVGRRWWGFMGYDECRQEREWSPVVVEALNAAADTLGTAIQRQDTERALRQREAQLQQAQRMEAVGRLTGGIAHDFNNLLTAIGGFAALARDDVDTDSPVARDIEEIIATVGRASALTRRLLDFSRRQVVEPELLDVNAVVRDMEGLVRRLLSADVELSFDLAPSIGSSWVDRTQLEQVLLNLLVNARDAVGRGGRIEVRTGPCTIPIEEFARRGLSRTDGYLELSVADDGPGMDREVANRIFEPFFTTKGKGEGTGLGLSTVSSIVRQLGGVVDVETAPGEGATFRVLLPMVVRSTGEEPAEVHRTVRGGDETILVVDDSEPVREVTRRLLEDAGYTVLVARDVRTATDRAADARGRLDLLLTDVILAGGTGTDAWDAVREGCGGCRVLYMSGYGSAGLEPEVPPKHRQDLLDKPFTPEELLHRVRTVLDRP